MLTNSRGRAFRGPSLLSPAQLPPSSCPVRTWRPLWFYVTFLVSSAKLLAKMPNAETTNLIATYLILLLLLGSLWLLYSGMF